VCDHQTAHFLLPPLELHKPQESSRADTQWALEILLKMKKLPATHAAPSAASKQESTNDKPFLWTAAAKTKLPTTSKRTCNAVAKVLLLLLPLQNLSRSLRQQPIRQ
jgi:hypothetical protein